MAAYHVEDIPRRRRIPQPSRLQTALHPRWQCPRAYSNRGNAGQYQCSPSRILIHHGSIVVAIITAHIVAPGRHQEAANRRSFSFQDQRIATAIDPFNPGRCQHRGCDSCRDSCCDPVHHERPWVHRPSLCLMAGAGRKHSQRR